MMREPWFWQDNSVIAQVIRTGLYPFSRAYQAAHKLRWKFAKPARAPIPIICIGNASLGGVGKTPFASMLYELLADGFENRCFLLRGYGGDLKGPLKADPSKHDASQIGDEALMLALRGDVYVSRSRRHGAQMAADNRANLIIMDDGFQNPSLEKSVSILLVAPRRKGESPHIFPAGPWRESLPDAKARADIVVYVSEQKDDAIATSNKDSGSFAAWLEPKENLPPQRCLAFCGIGRPEKFFETLKSADFDLAESISYPDHYQYSPQDLEGLLKRSQELNAKLITTEKDSVRLPHDFLEDVSILPVVMRVNKPDLLTAAICTAIDRRVRTD